MKSRFFGVVSARDPVLVVGGTERDRGFARRSGHQVEVSGARLRRPSHVHGPFGT